MIIKVLRNKVWYVAQIIKLRGIVYLMDERENDALSPKLEAFIWFVLNEITILIDVYNCFSMLQLKTI